LTRFLSHKVTAIKRFIECYGAYINHLFALTEDQSMKPVDKQELKGYVCKWQDGKILLDCVMVHDMLQFSAKLFSMTMYQ